jgi:hypothetical protein
MTIVALITFSPFLSLTSLCRFNIFSQSKQVKLSQLPKTMRSLNNFISSPKNKKKKMSCIEFRTNQQKQNIIEIQISKPIRMFVT